ncbi:MAG: peptidoglycan-binding domain-containing protein [Clostridium sp.]|uniref:peptidoglycan-binding domain-containing protein n=1 Tax=Clostridium sp. TaxID=1506 RepID=UPI002FC9D8EE
MNLKFLSKFIISVTIVLVALSSTAFANVVGSPGVHYNQMSPEMKQEVDNLNLSTNTIGISGKYVEYTYETAPDNVKLDYEAKCREAGITPQPGDKIMVKVLTNKRNYLVDTNDIKVYRDMTNRVMKFYYQRLWYTFPIDSTYVGYNHISRGKQVAMLQFLLTEWGYNPGGIDEIFGSRTHSSLLTFQGNKSLSQDGIAGPKVWVAF